MTAYIYKEIQAAQRDEALVARLLRLWEDSVRATHHFLNGNDIEGLKPFVIAGIKSTPIIYIAREGRARCFHGYCRRQDRDALRIAAPFRARNRQTHGRFGDKQPSGDVCRCQRAEPTSRGFLQAYGLLRV